MSLKRYLFLMTISTLFCWLAWLMVLFYIDPSTTGRTGLACFYFSLFFSLLGTFSLLGLIVRLIVKRDDLPFKKVGISLRQALWFSLIVIISLSLLAENLFMWWSAAILLFAFVALEAFFLTIFLDRRGRAT